MCQSIFKNIRYLYYIEISNNEIGDEGASEFAKALSKNMTLTCLSDIFI
jgi:hypothetical protein